jgi:putative transposase
MDEPVIEALQELVGRYPRYGFDKLFTILRRQGNTWNHKRVYRVYCGLGLNMRRKGKKRLPSRNPEPLSVPAGMNQCWSADFMSDALWCGRRFRTFNLVDDFNREALAIEVDLNLPAQRVIMALERAAARRGYPDLWLDNGPEMTSVKLAERAERNGVRLEFIKPGKHAQNAFIERFNRTYREEALDMYVFKRITEVREITQRWLEEYNGERPHEALGNLTPIEYLASQTTDNSINPWH